MTTDLATMTTKPRRRWQFTLRTFLIAVALIGVATYYGTHFWRLTVRGREHQAELVRQQQWIYQNMGDSFVVPSQYWKANEADSRWHQSKAEALLLARWFPWAEVDESDLPPLIEGESGFPPWTTYWRSMKEHNEKPREER
jgi:hypothetical protein